MQRAHDLPARRRLLVRRTASRHSHDRGRYPTHRLPLPRLPPRKNKSRRRNFRQRHPSNLKFFRDQRLARSRFNTFVAAGLKTGHYKIPQQTQSISTAGPVDVAPTSASRAVTAFAMRYKLCAAGADSPCAATGLPVSPPIRIRGSISISPSTGTPYATAVFVPSPCPKISTGLPQCGQANVLMFSTTPSTSTFTWRNISIALRTSATATSEGVVTTTAPVTATV